MSNWATRIGRFHTSLSHPDCLRAFPRLFRASSSVGLILQDVRAINSISCSSVLPYGRAEH
eukprot:508518-Hanusia_phi.AAC.8